MLLDLVLAHLTVQLRQVKRTVAPQEAPSCPAPR